MNLIVARLGCSEISGINEFVVAAVCSSINLVDIRYLVE